VARVGSERGPRQERRRPARRELLGAGGGAARVLMGHLWCRTPHSRCARLRMIYDRDKNRSGDRDSPTLSIHFVFGSHHDWGKGTPHQPAAYLSSPIIAGVRSLTRSLVPWAGSDPTRPAARRPACVWLARSLSVPAAPLLGGLHESALRGCGPRGGRPRRPRQVCAVH
jgi:hypothetical protein